MIDETLQELWSVKDNLAKEHAYDLDSLVDYLNGKYQSDGDKAQDHDYPSVQFDLEKIKAA